MRLITAFALIGGLPLCQLAHAQSAQAFSVQGSALYAGLFGKAYTGFNAGSGVEAQGRYTTTTGLSLGLGYQYTSHAVDGAAKNATLSGPFAEPRYTFEVSGHDGLYPYASVRLSSLKQKFASGGIESSASGFTADAGGGVLIRLTTRANLDVGATFGITNFGDFALVDPSTGQRIAGKTGSGSNFVLRVGCAVGLF